jgi:hypothetical protein
LPVWAAINKDNGERPVKEFFMQRKTEKMFLAGMFSVALALSLAACKTDVDNPHADFYGTWIRQGGTSTAYAITETILGYTGAGSVAGNIASWGDRIDNPSTDAAIKAQYPYGYVLTVTAIPGVSGANGGIFGMFLSTDKQSFRGESHVYLKQ